jgi:CRISPR system Cascade subunit CasE
MSLLYMVELRLDPAALIRFAEGQGINRREDEDLGYAAHAWLKAMFGADAPKPFRLLHDRRGFKPPRLLGFSRKPGDELAEHAHSFALPSALQACPLEDGFACKPMPGSWPAGRRLGFELLACPASRIGQREDDVYVRHLREQEEAGGDPQSRADLYRQWLARQLGDAARLEDFTLEAFSNVRLLRKAEGAGRRDFQRPQALLGGVLQVQDGNAFGTLLARGVGRHRAFGYGMLLLRPAP